MNGSSSSSSNNEAAEGQKSTKWSKELLMCRKLPPPLFRKSGSEIVNAVYIMKALGKSQLILKLKSPRLSSQDCFLYWTTLQSTSLPQSRSSNGGEVIMVIWHLSYLPDFASANVLLLLSVNSGLVDLLLSQNSFKTSLWGIIRTIAKDEFANTIQD